VQNGTTRFPFIYSLQFQVIQELNPPIRQGGHSDPPGDPRGGPLMKNIMTNLHPTSRFYTLAKFIMIMIMIPDLKPEKLNSEEKRRPGFHSWNRKICDLTHRTNLSPASRFTS